MRKIAINNRKVGEGEACFIIAEAGVNHNGSLAMAKKMINAAKQAGVDAIKFQTFKTEELAIENAPRANYQSKQVLDESQFEMLKKLELSESEFVELFSYCKKNQIMFLSTPFDFKSAEFLNDLGVPAFKVGSGDLNNIPLILKVAAYGKPLILSTGMSNLTEVKESVEAIYSVGNNELILLHCTSNYPTKFDDVNLKAMQTLQNEFGVLVGYSDHTEGIEVAVAAVAMGACVIEKHFTLDRTLPGPDHKASLEPNELKQMVCSIRNVEKAMGSGEKKPSKSEAEIKRVARKSIVAAVNIPKGTILTQEFLAIKRPGTGIEPKYLSAVIGKKTKRAFGKNQLIEWDFLE
jgi:N-acetylneuraminate synthase/N,N'-diacetyllegionaminate synthase